MSTGSVLRCDRAEPDDSRFEPDDTTPDDYAAGGGYGSAPTPGESGLTNAFPESSLGGTDDQPATPAVAPAAMPEPPEPPPGFPYGAVAADPGGPSATPAYGTPPPASSYGAPPAGASYGTPGAIPAGSPYLSPTQVSPAVPSQPWRPHTRQNRKRRGCGIGVALVIFVLASLVRACTSMFGMTDSEPYDSDPIDAGPDQIVTRWSVEPSAITIAPVGAGFTYNPDGAFTGPQIIAGEDAWIVSWTSGEYDERRGLAAVDPQSGDLLWERALTDVLCADRVVDGQLLCVAHEQATWVYHRIDPLTGEDLVVAPTTLEDVQTVHANGEVLVAVGPADPAPHAQFTGISQDGGTLWSFDVGTLENADQLFDNFFDTAGKPTLERPRWRDLDGGLIMLWATPGVAIIDPATGSTFVQKCRAATPAHDSYYCNVDGDLHRYALDGTLLWSSPALIPAVPDDSSDSRLVALSEPTPNQFEVIPVDLETGVVTGEATYRFGQEPGAWTGIVLPPGLNAERSATFVVGDTEMVALDPETGAAMWNMSYDYIYVGDVVQIGDVAILDASDVVGIDIATGDVLWERSAPFGDLVTIDDTLLSASSAEIAALELP